ncbi:MAG: hypothetical protein NZM04_00870 [Methylacidiphilales bacterium]|nr:hypothetical protein [Candidatus Methylacidiphilales bacterium]MDW8349761.1 hypothetical protein [Verrucomicrobiae bacterium]
MKFVVTALCGTFLVAVWGTSPVYAHYTVIAVEGTATVSSELGGAQPIRRGDTIPLGALVQTGPDGGLFIQKAQSFTMIQVTRDTRLRFDVRGLQQLLARQVRQGSMWYPVQASGMTPTLPVDVVDLEEGAIMGNFPGVIAVNTVLGYVFVDGTVPTQIYVASKAGNGAPSRAVPRARTTHKVLVYSKEGKISINNRRRVLKQVIDPKKGQKLPPESTVRALFDVAQAELIAQSEIARLLTPEDMEEEPLVGWIDPIKGMEAFASRVSDYAQGGSISDNFKQWYALEPPKNQNDKALEISGMSKVNTIGNEVLNNTQALKEALLLLYQQNKAFFDSKGATPSTTLLTSVTDPEELKKIALQVAQALASTNTSNLTALVPLLTPPATTPF